MELLFWLSVALVVYTYVGYPALAWCAGQLCRRHRALPSGPPPGLTVRVVVATYNEEHFIAETLESILRQPYPPELIEIVVADDGSTDATRVLVERFRHRGVRLIALPRGGKAVALNRAMRDCDAQIVVFTDADTRWLPDTLRRLLAPFGDAGVGGVAGHVAVTGRRGFADRVYRYYETFIRRAETRTGSCVSADGGMFALRRHLVEPVPPGVSDDFFLSTGAIARGTSLVYEPRAIALENDIARPSKQYRRRVRITVGGMQSLLERRVLMNPFRFGRFAVALISHKLLRRLAPAFLLVLFAVNAVLLAQGVVYQMLFVLQLFFYTVALAGLLDHRRRLPKPVHIASFIMLGNWATLIGVMQFVRGVRYTKWTPQKTDQGVIPKH